MPLKKGKSRRVIEENIRAVMALPGPKHVLIQGNTIIVRTGADMPPEPVKSADEVAADAAKSDASVKALLNMTPAEAKAWAQANITTLAQARDVIATLMALGAAVIKRL